MKNKNPLGNKICVICGKPYYVRGEKRRLNSKCCSSKCQGEYRRQHPDIFKNPCPPKPENIKVCATCGKVVKIRGIKRQQHGNFFCSMECMGIWQSKNRRGENHPNYTGYTDSVGLLRHTEEYNLWRKQVYERDFWTCKDCGKKVKSIIAHHIKCFRDYPELRFVVENGVTLCRSCHKIRHDEIGYNTRFKEQVGV